MGARKKPKGVMLSLESLKVSVVDHESSLYFPPVDTGGFRAKYNNVLEHFRYHVKIWAYPRYMILEKDFDEDKAIAQALMSEPSQYVWDSPEKVLYHKGVEDCIKEIINEDFSELVVVNAHTIVRAVKGRR